MGNFLWILQRKLSPNLRKWVGFETQSAPALSLRDYLTGPHFFYKCL